MVYTVASSRYQRGYVLYASARNALDRMKTMLKQDNRGVTLDEAVTTVKVESKVEVP